MPDLFERVRNLWDDHQERDKQAAVEQATEQIRDAVLGSALQLKQDWQRELIAFHDPNAFEGISADYRKRMEGLNTALGHISDVNPAITAKLDPIEFQKAVYAETSKALEPQVEVLHPPEYGQFLEQHRVASERAAVIIGYEKYPEEMHERIDNMLDWKRSELKDKGMDPIAAYDVAAHEVKARLESSFEAMHSTEHRYAFTAGYLDPAAYPVSEHQQISASVDSRRQELLANGMNPEASWEVASNEVRAQLEQSRSASSVTPAQALSKKGIITEVRDLHSQFEQLSEEYNNAPTAQRPHIREQMEPLVSREHELREEYTVRADQGPRQEMVPAQDVGIAFSA